MFWRYYEFSKEHPEYFALMFLDRSVPADQPRIGNRFGFVGEMKREMSAGSSRRSTPATFRAGTAPERGLPRSC